MDPDRAAQRVRELAFEEGFDDAGVAQLAPAATGPAFLRWLARGDQAGLGWMERRTERRLDPRRVLPGARSALCVAWRYAPDAGAEVGELWRRVARYARGGDYHRHMRERLERIGARIATEFPGVRSLAYVDTGPLLERELAARAGLGAFGKNTMLLSPRAGSWFLLGELLLTLDLAPGRPIADLCGECRRCLEACPTGALPEPYRLDANRCISYWTIEHRGAIPARMRGGIGHWVFGCDICQEVCPWNERAPPLPARPEVEPSRELRGLDLVAILSTPAEQLRQTLAGTTLLRPRPEGLRRNAAVALGNAGDRAAVPALAAALESDPSPLVRSHAAWALGRLGGAEARRSLHRAALREGVEEVRAEIVAASAHA